MTNDNWTKLFLDLLPGLGVSLQLTAGLLAIGLPLGLLLAVGISSKDKIVRYPAVAVVEVGRGVPALVLLYLVYFGLPQTGITLDAMPAAMIGLGVSFAAYTSEVFRAGIQSVPQGQTEAGKALGMSGGVIFGKVVMPQALKIVVPPLLGWAVIYFQATSLAFALAVPELLSRAYVLATTNFQYLNMLSLAAMLYAGVAIPLTVLAEHSSRRDAKSRTA
ncbi:amino acid ABC transporter permease [Arthrobacter sp. M4]|uniref:amino acid ABC transporter permease n=1 Tax=Arthrobacter sp. M4 TaxID=218160 RepID=UPI001CDB9A6D|nr:amino acid ABC transporter permease [Arthrobacter sp. M4]MCA4134810.1 amino acid ABC transporter permease [Arthrobacter sp. M4]